MRLLYVLAGSMSLPTLAVSAVNLRDANGVNFASCAACALMSGVLAASIAR